MEEILSSIRRIIAEDDAAGDSPSGRQAAKAPEADEDDVLELTDIVPEVEAPAARIGSAGSPAMMPALAQAPEQAMRPDSVREEAPMAAAPDTIMSSTTANASALALSRLAKAAAPEEKRPASAAASTTVEQLLVELLTPMLKSWLDENLPGIVERVVEQEVKKLARRAELL